MTVNLIKDKQMFSLTLPEKVSGRHWIRDTDASGHIRDLIVIEAVQNSWSVRSNRSVNILNDVRRVVRSVWLSSQECYELRMVGTDERMLLFAEPTDDTRRSFRKYHVREHTQLTIGREQDCDIYYNNSFVSNHHARLSYGADGWHITDLKSMNGIYVNGRRVESSPLKPGDLLYIMGLKLIVGDREFAMNDPDGRVRLQTQSLLPSKPHAPPSGEEPESLPDESAFYRAPRFFREIDPVEIKIDPPPAAKQLETVPLALMLGPSMTMGLASIGTGIVSVNQAIQSGGGLTQALPTILMSSSMLMGTVLWPILTKRHERKSRIRYEQKRSELYNRYLERMRGYIHSVCEDQSRILCTNLIGPDECAERIRSGSAGLWERTFRHSDFLRLRFGLGSLPMQGHVQGPERKINMDVDPLRDAMQALADEPTVLSGVPVSVSLPTCRLLGICGETSDRNRLLKALILQMLALHGYDELKLVLLADPESEPEFSFLRLTPHCWSNDRSTRFFAVTQDEQRELSAYLEKELLVRNSEKSGYTDIPPYYVILCTGKDSGLHCGIVRHLLSEKVNMGFGIIAMADHLYALPKEIGLTVLADGAGSRIVDRSDTSGTGIAFAADTVDVNALRDLAVRLANTRLDLSDSTFDLPSSLSFLEMFGVGMVEHLNSLMRWRENDPTLTLQAPVGIGQDGNLQYLDLHEKYHGPHGLVAGMTGSGKSEFLISYILSMAVNYHPDEVSFILIDYKGGGLAGAFSDESRGIRLPHLAGTITNLDGSSVNRSLISIQSELRRRQAVFNEARKRTHAGTMDIYRYQQFYRIGQVTEPMPHLFIISDEFAELKTQQPEFMEQLISAARIGRSLGIHLVLATQKPSGVVDDQIWSNSRFRVCLKVQERADSQDMIKRSDAAELSQTGRFYLQVGYNELFTMGQSAWSGADYIPADRAERNKDRSIQIIDRLGRVRMEMKPERLQTEENPEKQVVALVKYLSGLAAEEGLRPHALWLPPIPAFIVLEDLERKYDVQPLTRILEPAVGEYDDPYEQRQGLLTIPITREGNCLVYGSAGNGKTTFLTTLCWSLIQHHSAEELCLYLLDFAAGTLKALEQAPQVGGVVLSGETEKLENLFRMLLEEMEKRRKQIADYGDFSAYSDSDPSPMPAIVVVLNNYSDFYEQSDDLIDRFSLLTREGTRYGIYFVVALNSVTAMRYTISQNFKILLTMQMNDQSDYATVVGRTGGTLPAHYKGRGLVALEHVCEFQTAHCTADPSPTLWLRAQCEKLRAEAEHFAQPIPMLPELVTPDYLRQLGQTRLNELPLGIDRIRMQPVRANLEADLIYPVAAQELGQTVDFICGLISLLTPLVHTTVFDPEQLLPELSGQGYTHITADFDVPVIELFDEMVLRNNTYKDSDSQLSSLDGYEKRVYIIVGMHRLMSLLTPDGASKLATLLEYGDPVYRLHVILCDGTEQPRSYLGSRWYSKHASGAGGVWIGSGVNSQTVLKWDRGRIGRLEDPRHSFGYLFREGRAVQLKLLTSHTEREGGFL